MGWGFTVFVASSTRYYAIYSSFAILLLFLLWFPSGIVMMYWDFPTVTPADRLRHSAVLDPASIVVAPPAAIGDSAPRQMRINTFDGRPVYRAGTATVYADTGERPDVSKAMLDRMAASWAGQPIASVRIESIDDVDQWTVQGGLRAIRPLWKYSWPDGQQVYLSGKSGEVAHYTTTASRMGAYFGAIPHWLYFPPLRRNGPLWNRVVIWSSGIATFTSSRSGAASA